MTIYAGSCHCGAVNIQLTSDKKPEEMRIGRCDCGFCRRHGARTMGDPAGSVEFHAAPSDLSRYRFALGITDYLLCARCGTYVGAIMPDQGGTIGVVNVNSLDIRDTFDPAPPLRHYEGEDETARRTRRRKFWMTARVIA